MKSIFSKESFLFFLTLIFQWSSALSQASDIPIGTWRQYPSFNNVTGLAFGPGKVFSSTAVTLTKFENGEASTLYSRQPLSDADITFIEYSSNTGDLIISYDNGNIDIIENDDVINFSRFRDLNTIPGSKRINHVAVDGNIAYLSADFGVIVFDLISNEVKETWRDLGSNGEVIGINKSILYKDSIALATDKGVMLGRLADNLLDFSKWKRIDTGDFAGEIKSITELNGELFALLDEKGLYQYDGKNFISLDFLAGDIFHSLESGAEGLIITASENIVMFAPGGETFTIQDVNIPAPKIAREDASGALWVGDQVNGLFKYSEGEFVSYGVNGPHSANTFRLSYTDNNLFSLPGGFNLNVIPMERPGIISSYSNEGVWDTIRTSLNDITDAVSFQGRLFLSSFGDGLIEKSASGVTTVYNSSNSVLESGTVLEAGVYITDMQLADNSLYIANYGASQSMKKLNVDGSWQSFPISFSASRFPVNFTIDHSGNIWMGVDKSSGGGVIFYNPQTSETMWLTTASGGGGLPEETILSIVTDRDGNVWVGTEAGVAYFYSPNADAIRPIFENRFLLKDEKITAIAVDGGNRKWIGTERGVWLFNPSGDKLIHNFTTGNSPLFSDVINSIEINPVSGEVFFATEKGIISYRSDATSSNEKFDRIKIFPNPMTSEFTGTVGISGLATDAIVKITDVNGKVVWQGRASGGTAAWNVNASTKRPRTGVYLVFASSEDGSESMVGKIAVIE